MGALSGHGHPQHGGAQCGALPRSLPVVHACACREALPSPGLRVTVCSIPRPQALPFAVRAVDAEHIYESWCRKSTPMLRPPAITAMYTYFLPFWVFEAELTTRVGGSVYHKYADGAAMQVYGGHTFRRRMTEVLKSDASRAVPFSASMMDGMDNRVDIDEWSVFERTALDLIREQVLQEEAEIHYDQHPDKEVEVSYTRLTSRRVLMPAHIVE